MVPSTPVVLVAISRHVVSFADLDSMRTNKLLIGNLSGSCTVALTPSTDPNSRAAADSVLPVFSSSVLTT